MLFLEHNAIRSLLLLLIFFSSSSSYAAKGEISKSIRRIFFLENRLDRFSIWRAGEEESIDGARVDSEEVGRSRGWGGGGGGGHTGGALAREKSISRETPE